MKRGNGSIWVAVGSVVIAVLSLVSGWWNMSRMKANDLEHVKTITTTLMDSVKEINKKVDDLNTRLSKVEGRLSIARRGVNVADAEEK